MDARGQACPPLSRTFATLTSRHNVMFTDEGAVYLDAKVLNDLHLGFKNRKDWVLLWRFWMFLESVILHIISSVDFLRNRTPDSSKEALTSACFCFRLLCLTCNTEPVASSSVYVNLPQSQLLYSDAKQILLLLRHAFSHFVLLPELTRSQDTPGRWICVTHVSAC